MVVSGQVFIVTKSRENIKLALVEVAAIPESDLVKYVKIKRASGAEKKELLKPAYDASLKDAAAASAAHARAQEKMERATRALLAGRGKETPIDESIRTLNVHTASIGVAERANEVEYSRKMKALNLKSDIDYFDSGRFYFEGLPSASYATKTDADGRFSLSLPEGKYVLAATASREVGRRTEVYHWLVVINAPNQALMLSNDNEFQTKCRECVQPDAIP